MTNYILSTSEKILLSLTVIVVFVSIILALCIGLVLPSDFINGDSHRKDLSGCNCDGHLRFEVGQIYDLGGGRASFVGGDHPPHLVSLHTRNYTGNNIVQRLACSGVIVLQNWVLVGRECADDDKEWLKLKVRAGSDYWDKYGVVYNVIKYVYLEENGPALLQVSPPFTLGEYINTVEVPEKVFKWSRSLITYWRKGKIHEKDMYISEAWEKNPQVGSPFEGELIQNVSCDPKHVSSGALISTNSKLIAFRVGLCNTKQVFVNFRRGPYATWIRGLVVEGKPRQFIVQPDNLTPVFIYRLNLDNIRTSLLVPRPVDAKNTNTANNHEMFVSKSSSHKKVSSTSTTKKHTSKDDVTRVPPTESEINSSSETIQDGSSEILSSNEKERRPSTIEDRKSTSFDTKVSSTSTTKKNANKDDVTRVLPTESEINSRRETEILSSNEKEWHLPRITDTTSEGSFLSGLIGAMGLTMPPATQTDASDISSLGTTTDSNPKRLFGE